MFKILKPEELKDNPFSLIGKEWLLIAATDGADKCNMMSASWGGLGVLWNKPVATVYIRPTRYTETLMDKDEFFALNFMGGDKSAHKVCGNESGRDTDKLAKTGLTAVYADGTVYFEEAELVLVCRKVYKSVIDRTKIVDSDVHKMYPIEDYHNIYVGEIVKILAKPERT